MTEDVKKMEEALEVYLTHAGAVNTVLKPLASVLGLYDFGGGNFVVPLPGTMNLNGKEQNVYIITFEDGK